MKEKNMNLDSSMQNDYLNLVNILLIQF